MSTYPKHNIKNVHYDQYLTNISVAYKGNTNNYIAEDVVPVVSVSKQADRYMVFDYMEHMQEDDDIRRSPGSVASEMRTGFSDDAYYCEGFAKRYALYPEEIANADEERIFRLKERAAQAVKDKLLLAKELKTAALMTNPMNFHADLRRSFNATEKWSDYTNSDPQKDIFKLRETAERLGAPNFNVLVLSKPVYNRLKFHPKLKATLAGFISPEMVSDEAMRQLFDVDRIIIAESRKAGSELKRVGDGMTNYIWGNNAILMYLPSAPSMDTPAAAYTFQWDNPQANVVGNQKTREYYVEESKTHFVETEEWYGQKVVSKICAAVLSDVVTPFT
ncbi:hypothetical protein SECTIM467_26 [Brevibacillus phage SecTim467]|uniref:Capsid protein n=2 Tax=Jenstvirus jenst TaxID=1982225 RepID=A0A0K2CP25_9CAUD|nr:major head protein [Brevibacillus phage Jenst]ALA07156.1 putative capsid related protein [Brevibacillus phage Jenst]ALA07526.1 hypothetical protein SECTIM467_26 [Brevibacillus phage SecTim467]